MTYSCDVAIIGGGMGGVAAALAACEMGSSAILTEETDWLGGQMTSQGVSALDEHKHIEHFGGTRTYYDLRNRIRAYYSKKYNVPQKDSNGTPLNPGNGWVSRLCFEPAAGEQILRDMLKDAIDSGRLRIFCNTVAQSARTKSGHVMEISALSADCGMMDIRAKFFLDASELGDLLPMIEAPFVTGAEGRSDTGEPSAPENPCAGQVQSFTYPFAIEYRSGEDHTISKPHGYEKFRDSQPYTLTLMSKDGSSLPYRVFEHSPDGFLPFWTYRRLLEGRLLGEKEGLRDIAMINWAGNDYYGGNILDCSLTVRKRLLNEAKQLSLGFLYWLQTEVPRDEGNGRGYPELKLLPEVMGTPDGLSKYPYVRESRRILALERIVEQDIVSKFRPQRVARSMPDSVGVGWYPIDIHPCFGGSRGMDAPTFPFQIPFGALVPRGIDNLLAACKNIGVTHITNGSYRLHPVEWNIGESAGTIAAYCVAERCCPLDIWKEFRSDPKKNKLRQLQQILLERGVPIAWTLETPMNAPGFINAQMQKVEDDAC